MHDISTHCSLFVSTIYHCALGVSRTKHLSKHALFEFVLVPKYTNLSVIHNMIYLFLWDSPRHPPYLSQLTFPERYTQKPDTHFYIQDDILY